MSVWEAAITGAGYAAIGLIVVAAVMILIGRSASRVSVKRAQRRREAAERVQRELRDTHDRAGETFAEFMRRRDRELVTDPHPTQIMEPPFVFSYTMDDTTVHYEAPTLDGLLNLRKSIERRT